MNTDKLIGMRVMNHNSNATGSIESISDGIITVKYHDKRSKHSFPSCFAEFLEIEDEKLQEKLFIMGLSASFDIFKRDYHIAINQEINYLKATGGKRYRILDGEKIPTNANSYLYSFDTDTDLHFPDGTAIKLWFPDEIVDGYIVSCEDFTILIRTAEDLGDSVQSVEFTSEQWQLLDSLMQNLDEMEAVTHPLACEVACGGRRQLSEWPRLNCGQNQAFQRATSERITFIWGPPGTGKTEVLANIALEHINQGRRVLMLSYSNVSVDGALLRVAHKSNLPDGMVIRYGYPRTKELLESDTLSSYQYVLHTHPDLEEKYQDLIEKKKKLKRKDPERIEINKALGKIREKLQEEEEKLISHSKFVATTVSKATVDAAVYAQRFDVVIFDEASMALVPQIVFSAGLAKSFFVCLGDFCQLPAIVQNPSDDRLYRDIFDYTYITSAVSNNQNHEWLVMLDEQYRMHPDIAEFVSEYMYQARLRTSDTIIASRKAIAKCNPCPEAAMSLVDLSGMYSVCTKTSDGSRINIMSALVCLRLAEINIDQQEIGIITPYSAQSRLILAMIRDIQEYDSRWQKVSCATVHQFQGSEKSVVIYDAVDCFRMPYPGTLLTSLKNDTANRLFNVALTRAKGKFILVANVDYMKRKNISKKLIFTEAMKIMQSQHHDIEGDELVDELLPDSWENPIVYMEDRDTSWNLFVEDIEAATSEICIDMPDVIDDNSDAIGELAALLSVKRNEGVKVSIRLPEKVVVPRGLQKFTQTFNYTTTPLTVIDKQVVWFGQPLYAADFVSEGTVLETEYFPCLRFVGGNTGRLVKAFLEM